MVGAGLASDDAGVIVSKQWKMQLRENGVMKSVTLSVTRPDGTQEIRETYPDDWVEFKSMEDNMNQIENMLAESSLERGDLVSPGERGGVRKGAFFCATSGKYDNNPVVNVTWPDPYDRVLAFIKHGEEVAVEMLGKDAGEKLYMDVLKKLAGVSSE